MEVVEFIAKIMTLLTAALGVVAKIPDIYGKKLTRVSSSKYYYSHKKYLEFNSKVCVLLFDRIYWIQFWAWLTCLFNVIWIAMIQLGMNDERYSMLWSNTKMNYCIFAIYVCVIFIIYYSVFRNLHYKYKVLDFNGNLFKFKNYNSNILLFLLIAMLSIAIISCVWVGINITYINPEYEGDIFNIYLYSNILFPMIATGMYIYYFLLLMFKIERNMFIYYLPDMHVTIKFNDGEYYRYELDKSEITLHSNARVNIFHSKEGPLSFGDVKEIYAANTKFIFQNDKWIRCESMN